MIRPGTPSAPRRPGTPKQFRAMLIVFTVRHLMGLGLFGWLLWQAMQTGGTSWLIIAVAGGAYAAFAAYGWLRLRGQYVRSLRGTTPEARP